MKPILLPVRQLRLNFRSFHSFTETSPVPVLTVGIKNTRTISLRKFSIRNSTGSISYNTTHLFGIWSTKIAVPNTKNQFWLLKETSAQWLDYNINNNNFTFSQAALPTTTSTTALHKFIPGTFPENRAWLKPNP